MEQLLLKILHFDIQRVDKLFDNLTLEVQEGQKVAVVGKIGSGKSSL